MNMGAIMKIKSAWETFTYNHPKFPLFLNAVKTKGVPVDTIVSISFTYPDGKVVDTNLKVTPSDLELFEVLKNIK
ncbi:MAG: hypothetical protein K6G26_06365 [Lachnospiraceae bacterium]|nr:hypothetical protein [Lachnospiraceae bacterium]